MIGGMWKPLLLWAGGTVLRFNELQKSQPDVNTKKLTKQLLELQESG